MWTKQTILLLCIKTKNKSVWCKMFSYMSKRNGDEYRRIKYSLFEMFWVSVPLSNELTNKQGCYVTVQHLFKKMTKDRDYNGIPITPVIQNTDSIKDSSEEVNIFLYFPLKTIFYLQSKPALFCPLLGFGGFSLTEQPLNVAKEKDECKRTGYFLKLKFGSKCKHSWQGT